MRVATSGPNLLRNPSFEEGTGLAKEWTNESKTAGKPTFTVSDTIGVVTGGHAQRMVYEGTEDDDNSKVQFFQAPVEGVEWFPLSIRFDNDAREYVHVYLVGDGRQWLLGRVEPGAVATLKVPDAALGARLRFVQLAVIQGGRLTPDAVHDRRAELTTLQPAVAILSQQWRFTQGEIRSLAARR